MSITVKNIQLAALLMCVAGTVAGVSLFVANVGEEGSWTFVIGMALATLAGAVESLSIFTQMRSRGASRPHTLQAVSRVALWGALIACFLVLAGSRAGLIRP